jgi:hypothetical protein
MRSPARPCGPAILCQNGLEWLLLEALRIIESFLSHDKKIERGGPLEATDSGKRNLGIP